MQQVWLQPPGDVPRGQTNARCHCPLSAHAHHPAPGGPYGHAARAASGSSSRRKRRCGLQVTAAAVVARQGDGTAEAALAALPSAQQSRAAAAGEELRGAGGSGGGAHAAAGFDSVESALEAVGRGEFVVVLDDEDRENEGDLIMAADKVTPADVEFLRKHTSGFICVGMEGGRLDELALPLMVASAANEEAMYTAFTVTVDAREGISTGISAEDRALTLRALADPASAPGDFRRPGHICPLRSRPGGVLMRPGHTEAGVDLARLAGCQPAGVLAEVINPEDGSMARTPQLLEFAREHGLKCITVAQLVRYRLSTEGLPAADGPSPQGSANGAGQNGAGQ